MLLIVQVPHPNKSWIDRSLKERRLNWCLCSRKKYNAMPSPLRGGSILLQPFCGQVTYQRPLLLFRWNQTCIAYKMNVVLNTSWINDLHYNYVRNQLLDDNDVNLMLWSQHPNLCLHVLYCICIELLINSDHVWPNFALIFLPCHMYAQNRKRVFKYIS